MALDPNPRILSGPTIALDARNNREILVTATATFTPGVEVTELVFPDPAVGFVFPRLGTIALQLGDGTDLFWVSPISLQLTQEGLPSVPERLNLVAVALIPNVGCSLDASSQYIS